MTATEPRTDSAEQKVSLPTLTAMVVGSMIGSGVFLLPRRFGTETGVLGALIAWTIAGTGMLMLAFVFQRLAVRKPDLNAGIFTYAKAGFGDYIGFNSAIGYWASACAGNTSYWVLITTTLSAVVPGFGSGDTILAVAVSTIGVWSFAALVMRGVRDAAVINYIVTVAKVLPILVFIVIALVAFEAGVFSDNFWGDAGGYSFASVWDQATGTMLITVFVFLGIEGAAVYSRMARRREDVGKATVFGFLGVLGVFAMVTLVSYGVLPQDELAGVAQPSMASVLESIVGPWGAVFIKVGVIVSVLGAYLAWTLMAAEVLFIPAKSDDMPRFLARTNRHDAPVTALVMAAALTTLLLVALLFAADALDFMLDLTAALSLIPYLLAAAYALKLTATRETYEDRRSLVPDMVIAAVATVYTLFLVYAAGIDKLLLSCILYAPAAALYVKARRERGLRVFRPAEAVLFGVILIGAVAGVVSLATGAIEI
ncbi:transporter, basic amino acid/polyamine antiporter (APA) family [Mycolicibacterium phlei]|jgi:arginine:ornithine antiporter/lysine permease|uniref:Amino acid APC transporter n=1 Tax=Mycolicibacterium phlei DSM 43239 = CCUG 21000 TaxID=1226750 RepID=A0A5N5UQ85_MYCPH|nr:basic amino acid/polyamine antiporter [Mycolicibacterium phlei]VEG08225.1 transporter, basic amino acid/polyamine antiporter (APA) family [Mycobacteroides chelonae]AMO60104.1 Arginine/ornithine antiporter [Mycolicibacterium phlei]KAB7751761.1 amino acid APC transporter [Mycolicibacterium phlei DSM 43239 = CCUG 21000]KXW60346.1 amino acid APC transporter [Mycolicibacterium phlei DSM 43239 = CCUG 21000]KXW66574.1 amino acid APC transporter [Mycolicibacterium phlei DSM 43072]